MRMSSLISFLIGISVSPLVSSEILVLLSLQFFSVPSSVMIQQCLSTVVEGANATLYCNATGNPVPSVAWIRASTGEVVSSNKVLAIKDIKRNESGSYQCLAWNGIASNSTKSCTVDVQCKSVLMFTDILQSTVKACTLVVACIRQSCQ